MERLRLFFYREGEHFEYPADVREAYGEPVRIPLFHEDAAQPDGFDTVASPAEADFIVFPYKLDPIICHRRTAFTRNYLEDLPYFAQYEHKHALFNFHDLGQPLCTRACIVTDDPARSNRDDPFVHPYPHFPMAHVLRAAPDYDFGSIRFDVSFVGTISDEVRLTLLESVQREKRLRHYLNAPKAPDWDRSASYLHMADEGRKRALERLYVGVMRRSWATLCPRGRGSSSYRFFETMCMGRLPVHMSDEYVLPLADRVDYKAFCLFVPEREAWRAGELVHRWLADKRADERQDMCRLARKAWEKHLAPQYAQDLVLDILRAHKAVLPKNPPRLVRQAPGCLKAEAPRRCHPAGYFAGLVLDDGRSWFNGAMLAQPGSRPDTMLVNGVPGELPQAALNLLYHAGRVLPVAASVVDLGAGAGLSSIVFGNALLSRRNIRARIFCVDGWSGAAREEMLGNARNAGVEFLLTPLALPGAEAARLFRDGSLDLLFLNRGRGVADLADWWDKLRSGGMVLGCCGAPEAATGAATDAAIGAAIGAANAVADDVADAAANRAANAGALELLRTFALERGAAWERGPAGGLFRITKPGARPEVGPEARPDTKTEPVAVGFG